MRIGLRRQLLELFEIRSGEGLTIGLLLLYSSFSGIVVGFFFTVANGAFLSRLDLSQLRFYLPFAYMASGIVASLAAALFATAERRLSLATLLLGNTAGLLLVVGSFAVGFKTTSGDLLSIASFVAVVPILTLLDLGFWGLAGRLLDLEQSKRLLGIISSGEVLSAALSFLAVPLLYRAGFDAVLLLALATAALLATLLLLPIIFARHQECLRTGGETLAEPAEPAEPGTTGTETTHQNQSTRRYLRLMTGATLLFILTQYFVDYSFLTEIRQAIPQQAELTRFLGWFFFATKTLELIVKTIGLGRLLRHLGLLAGLIILPLALLVPIGGGAIHGWFGGEVWMTVYLVMAKWLELALRKAVFDPSFKVLYQPLPLAERLRTQTRIEALVRQIGLFAAGGLLALLARSPILGGLEPRLMIMASLLSAWLAVSLALFREYRERLLEALDRQPSQLLKAPLETLREQLEAAQRNELKLVLNVLQRAEPDFFERSLAELLRSPKAASRTEAVERVIELRLVHFRERIERLEVAESEADLRQLAAAALRILDQTERSSNTLEKVTRLAASRRPADRQLAAQALLKTLDSAPQKLLFELLADRDSATRRLALLAAGRDRRSEFWPTLVQQLEAGQFSQSATAALIRIGEDTLPVLEAGLRRCKNDQQTVLRILRTCGGIDSAAAGKLLFEYIDHPLWGVRQQVLRALSSRGFRATSGQRNIVLQQLDEVIDRIAWYLASDLDLRSVRPDPSLLEAIAEQLVQDRQTLYLLLGLVCDPRAIRLMRDHL